MTPLSPHYPPSLQPVINHALRFAELLSWMEGAGRAEDAPRGWLTGRASELETVVGCLVADWQDDRLSAEAAAQA
ncbi:MAG: hypothetical protein ACRELB_24715, partial [Polyangiaceae bacterium]